MASEFAMSTIISSFFLSPANAGHFTAKQAGSPTTSSCLLWLLVLIDSKTCLNVFSVCLQYEYLFEQNNY